MRLLHILKSAGKITAIVFVSIITVGVLTGIFYEKEIKQLFITGINSNVDTKISVREFDFSVLRHFPFASFELKDVMMEEVSANKVKDTLLSSKNLSLLFNVLDLFGKDIRVKKIVIEDGSINIKIDSAGHGNYRFWKTGGDSSAGGELDIQKIILKNIYLKYDDLKANQQYALLAKEALLSGKFSNAEFSLNTNADLFIDKMLIHRINYVDHKPVIIKSGMLVNTKKGIYTFAKSEVRVADIFFGVDGSIANAADSWTINLNVNSREANMSSFISVLPSVYSDYLKKYKSKGKFVFSSQISGPLENKNIPSIKISFAVKDGSLISGGGSLEKINLSGSFDNHRSKKSTLDIPSLSASLSGHIIQASLKLEDMPDAFLTLSAKTQVDLKEIKSFIQSDTLESLSGNLAMNISYAGKIKDISRIGKETNYDLKASGNIDLANVCFKLVKNPLEFKNMSGNFSLHNNDVIVKNFTGNISSTDFRVDGIFKNFISFLLIPGQPGDVQASVRSVERRHGRTPRQ